MLHAGLDLSRKKIDVCLLDDEGDHLDQLIRPPDGDALKAFARRINELHGQPVCAVIELIDHLERDRPDQQAASSRPRQSPLHPAADERTWDRLGPRLHDCRRDR